jgi:hypothetical protein
VLCGRAEAGASRAGPGSRCESIAALCLRFKATANTTKLDMQATRQHVC